MPSVDVSWWGCCPEPARQRAICERIGDIGKLADELLDQNGYRFWDCRLEGDIIAADDVFPADRTQPVEEGRVRVSGIRVFGAEFRLADPRNLYPGEDRASFVFATLTQQADQSGTLVLVEGPERCKLYRRYPLIQAADYYLCTPRVHLRYFAEKWMDLLLAFIRRFHMPELHYWRWIDLPGDDHFPNIDPSDQAGRERAWQEVRLALVAEAAEWMPKGRELGAMVEHMQRTGEMPLRWFTDQYQPLRLDISLQPNGYGEQDELQGLLRSTHAAFAEAARNAVFSAGKGLNLHHVPLDFGGQRLSLRTALEPGGDTLRVEVRFATADLPDHAIAADEAARSGN